MINLSVYRVHPSPAHLISSEPLPNPINRKGHNFITTITNKTAVLRHQRPYAPPISIFFPLTLLHSTHTAPAKLATANATAT